jgi:hypothetical protein
MFRALWAGVRAAARGLGGIIKSVFTGPDGVSWAPGRIMGFGVFMVGQCLIVRASASVLANGLSPSEWQTFFAGVAGFEAVDCGTAIGLVLGMAPADPGGKWWGKEASAPQPPDRPR